MASILFFAASVDIVPAEQAHKIASVAETFVVLGQRTLTSVTVQGSSPSTQRHQPTSEKRQERENRQESSSNRTQRYGRQQEELVLFALVMDPEINTCCK